MRSPARRWTRSSTDESEGRARPLGHRIAGEEARGEGNPDDGGFPELGDDLEEPELLTDSY